MSDVPGGLEPAQESALLVIRELRESGVNNLEDLIKEAIEGSHFALRGRAAQSPGVNMRMASWTFISRDYVYTGGGSGSRLW